MKIGSTIQQLREKRGLNQGQLADKLKISQTYLSQIESNKRVPNINLLERISSTIKAPLPFLLLLSMDIQDVPEEKKAHFILIEPLLKKFVEELIN